MGPLFLLFQRFRRGEIAAMPYAALAEVLGRHGGKLWSGRADTELSFEPERIAHYGYVIGGAKEGVQCLALERPILDDPLRALAFELLERFDCCLFDDALEIAYSLAEGPAVLPSAMAARCLGGWQRVSQPKDLWPAEMMEPPKSLSRPALRYPNANPNGPHLMLFDHAYDQRLQMHYRMPTAACNPATLRVLRHHLLRVDDAQTPNPEFAVELHTGPSDEQMNDCLFMALLTPQIATHCNKGIICTSMSGEPKALPFELHFGVHRISASDARTTAELAERRHGIPLRIHQDSLPQLERMLEKLHALSKQTEREPGFTTHTDADGLGCYLGQLLIDTVGGQWGMATLMGRQIPAVRTNSGHVVLVKLWALSVILMGYDAELKAQIETLCERAKPVTAPGTDISTGIPYLCSNLVHMREVGCELPLKEYVPAKRLDYSIESLAALDEYLHRVHVHLSKQDDTQMRDLILAAGAYLGEVIRRHRQRGWDWLNHEDYFRDRERIAGLEYGLHSCVLLVGHGFAVMPMAQVQDRVTKGRDCSVLTFAHETLDRVTKQVPVEPSAVKANAPAAKPAAQAATPPVASGKVAAASSTGIYGIRPIDSWPDNPQQRVLLANLRLHVEQRRQQSSDIDYSTLCAELEPWLASTPLRELESMQKMLLKNGKVLWASLFQANNQLFSADGDDLPAVMVYSRAVYFDGRVSALRQLCHDLFALKGTRPHDPELRRIIEGITDESVTRSPMGWPVPAQVSVHELKVTTFMGLRKHLPDRRLDAGWFPILSHPTARTAMILPCQWWTGELLALWRARQMME